VHGVEAAEGVLSRERRRQVALPGSSMRSGTIAEVST
jgi:hypothetical protein